MSRSDILLSSIDDFYADIENVKMFKDVVIHKNNGISLRTLENFITNYSKYNNCHYTTTSGKIFTVHCAYKSSLDGYSKKLFDPFARAQKFEYTLPATGENVITTVAQLNFMRWVIKNEIIHHIKLRNMNTKRKQTPQKI